MKQSIEPTASAVWIKLLSDIMLMGNTVSPRGQLTKEILQHTIALNMREPVVKVPLRKLSYQFMAAEAFWILSGDDKVETIEPYNKNIAQFSDDGKTFFGAYGPKIVSQLAYIVEKLRGDKDSRQAGLTIWRENPPETKDVPCTVAIWFNIRNDLLNCHVFMRSSDAWLGIPYDVFNFSMLGHMVCALYNTNNDPYREVFPVICPGTLYLTAASSHIYDRNAVDVANILASPIEVYSESPTPETLYLGKWSLLQWLKELRDSKPGDKRRWWEN